MYLPKVVDDTPFRAAVWPWSSAHNSPERVRFSKWTERHFLKEKWEINNGEINKTK